MATFIINGRPNAARIPNEVWEDLRPIMVEKYKTMTLSEVRDWMKREHNFSATRQYVHRFLHVWKLKKYKQNTSPPASSPDISALAVGTPPRLDGLPGTPHDVPPAEPHEEDHHFGSHPLYDAIPPPTGPYAAAPGLLPPPIAFPPAPAPACPPPAWAPPPALASLAIRDPRSWTPLLSPSPDSHLRYARLASMLSALGDAHHAFAIHSSLWTSHPWHAHAVACIRTAQSHPEIESARRMVRAEAAASTEDDTVWETKLTELLLAHTHLWGPDPPAGLERVARIVRAVVRKRGKGRDRLKIVTPRPLPLDIPLYLFFRSALVWHNSASGGGCVDVRGVLKQFLGQQPAFPRGLEHAETDPLLGIDCLSGCLAWCAGVLRGRPALPAELFNVVGAGPVVEACAVLCVLWRVWLGYRPEAAAVWGYHDGAGRVCYGDGLGPCPAWGENARAQMGIEATELLGVVVGMVMAAVPRGQQGGLGMSLAERALAGASILEGLSSEDLVRRFLEQVWASNKRVMTVGRSGGGRGQEVREGLVSAEVVGPLRAFVAGALGVYDLPVLEPGAAVYPLVLGELG
ncbi:hypothetical protein C8A05DRAFT_29820 [Staphylotrichum tortipilum]|uniref:Clr5 domain-containing protein n=1 Tax=Staphylotrichum tortipilum TaxID=2831512 RepID=A0AAN6RWQ9_9PEZI|nr:hypothetical protein C8A05DRAFT_29820 [Staphylotrichum longicolle]